ncbi:DDE superfamily endonuclease [Popillia japonica]|uniref:DDE superfamily endonuclease n=1 Tax=Popillia japonica TaxID=7064 RepID=A0AAW1JFS4_POPJA
METGNVPGLLLGDNGYACKNYLLTPVLQPENDQETRYNRAHIRTRNIVERLFGIWKKRFPCLHRGLQTKLDTSVAIIYMDEPIGVRNIPDAQRGLDFRRHFIEQHFGNQ